MNTELKEMRMMQIAAKILYKNCGNIRIEKVVASFWDLIVTNINEGYSFAVSVKGSTYNKSKGFEQYCKEYAADFIANGANVRMPVLLMCVNESDESALVCQMLYLRGDSYVVNNQPTRRSLNAQNWPVIEDNLRQANRMVFSLNQSNWKIKKTITITVADHGRNASARVIYLRDFTPEYKMHQKEPSDNQEKIMRLIKGIPEDEYPSDTLDAIILKCFEDKYGHENISHRSDTMFFSTDLKTLEMDVKDHEYVWNRIAICPDIMNDPQASMFNGITLPVVTLDLIVDFDFGGHAFHENTHTAIVPIKEFLEEYMRNELHKTVHSPFDFVV